MSTSKIHFESKSQPAEAAYYLKKGFRLLGY